MHSIFKVFIVFFFVLSGTLAQAANKLVINAVEFGVAKFHRYDNKVHPYGNSNAWSSFILPDDADTQKPLIQKNDNGSFTIFYSTLEELVQSAAQISEQQQQPISVLNINGHGLPGAMWFPVDAKTMKSKACADWVDSANGHDVDNYNQYYTAISKEDIMEMRQYAQNSNSKVECVTGLPEWKKVVKQNPQFKEALAKNLQVNFMSCIVGLGKIGKTFTEGMANLLLKGEQGRIETSTNYGLGDWSMPEGMGFWDYINDEQLARDNANYPVNKQDREEMQKGVVRVAQKSRASKMIGNQDFMTLEFRAMPKGPIVAEPKIFFSNILNVTSIRVPGTTVRLSVRSK